MNLRDRLLAALLLVVGSWPGCAGPAEGPPADLVLTNGAVYTVDARQSRAEAVAIRGGRIAHVGTDAGAAAFVGPGTRVVDLSGRMLLPGFQDAHVHPVSAGVEHLQCSLDDIDGLDAVLAEVRRCAERRPDDAWIRGAGWTLDLFPQGLPDKKLLDAIDPDRPISLGASDGHTLWVNSRALAIAGIDADTPDPALGRIDRYPGTREPSGSLQETAMTLVSRLEPAVGDAELADGLRHAVRLLNGFGITAIQDASVKLDGIDRYRGFPAYRALDDAGELTLRVVAAMYWREHRPMEEQIADFVAARERHTRGRLRATSVKIFQDGVIEARTAALLEPYVDGDDGYRGEEINDPERLQALVTRLDALGFQVHFHAIGDRAIRSCLDAVEAAREANGTRDARHHIAHVQLPDATDVPRFAALGVAANFQPLWAYADAYITDLTLPRIGAARGRFLYPIQTFLDAGAVVAFGSDWNVSSANPLLGIETAVTRRGALGETDAAFLPEQRIALADAIAAYTLHAAWVNFMEAETGSIEVGKLADLVVLDRDLFAVAPEQISEVRVVATLLEGEVVHGALP